MNDRTWIRERLEIIRDNLIDYPDSWLEGSDQGRPRPCICWPDGSDLGMGWASHMSGDPGGFKLLGFKGYIDFHSLTLKKRNDFLKKGLKIFTKFFPVGKINGKTKELFEKGDKIDKELKKLAKKYDKYKDKKNLKKIPKLKMNKTTNNQDWSNIMDDI